MHEQRKKILFLSRKAPYGSEQAKEAIDAMLVAAAYGQEVSVLFLDDGVFQLLQNQTPETINRKNTAKMISAFELYDLKNIYVDQDSLQQRQIEIKDLIIPVEILENSRVVDLMHQQNQILSF